MGSVETPTGPRDDGLRRQLGLGSVTALVVGEVIGVGICPASFTLNEMKGSA
jgi:hypothetical protein